ncbi:MAG: NAD-dependent epimerase/dehydratase family protein [Gemmatimonadota bacterium]
MTERRGFIRQASLALGGAVLARGLQAQTDAAGQSVTTPAQRAPRRILVLGGTGFIGPHLVRYAASRGHQLSVFNRGRRQADIPATVQQLTGDRDTGDLASLGGKTWDVIIDIPTTLPFWVRDAGQALRNSAQHYIFVSTISTYAHYRRAGMDETYELAAYTGTEDPMSIRRSTGALYGPLKVLSEREGEKWFPGRTTVVRPGLIVGPGDPTDRFTYWPVRVDRGGEVLCPGSPTDPTQIIDVRDLAEFIVKLAEERVIGTFNATGPRAPLSMAEMIYGCRAVTSGSNDVRFVWADASFLAANRVRGWSDMPTWLASGPDNQGWGRVSIERALAAGLVFRPLALTARDTIDWFATLSAERRGRMLAGLAPEREKEVLDLWRARTPG